MKPFDLEKAKNGERICTRGGRGARFLGVVKNGTYPVVAAYVDSEGDEYAESYTSEGCISLSGEDEYDLVMDTSDAGYINIFKDNICGGKIWRTREEAEKNAGKSDYYIATARVEWGD